MILLVVDVQCGLDDPQYGARNNPRCEERVAALIHAWRAASLPVLYSRHLSLRPGSPLAASDPRSAIKPEVAPLDSERVFAKSTNSVFKRPELVATLAELKARDHCLVGMATDACVTASAREAHDLGFRVTVVGDACATFERRSCEGAPIPAETVHRVALASLAASGMVVAPASAVIDRVGAAAAGASAASGTGAPRRARGGHLADGGPRG